nr:MAG TPA: hypothetical protein [Bacteriophage sp.]
MYLLCIEIRLQKKLIKDLLIEIENCYRLF